MYFDMVLAQCRGDLNLEGLDDDGLKYTAFLVPSGADEKGGGGIVAANLAESVEEIGF